MRLALEHLDGRALELGLVGLRPLLARPRHGIAPDGGEHAGRLFAAHHRDAGGRPCPHEVRAVSPSAHAIVSRTERSADHHGDLGHRGCGHRRDQLGAVPGDALVLVFAPHHETGDVLQEYQRDAALTAQLHEMRALLRGLREQHPVVGDDPDRPAVDMGKAGDQRVAEAGLELVKARAVDDAGDDLADVVGLAQVRRHDAEQILRVIGGRFRRFPLQGQCVGA